MAEQISKEGILRQLLQQCSGFDGDQISQDRKRAWDYYFQRKRGDEVDNRSNVVSGDVSAMVEAILAQMMDAFGNSNIAEFDPLGPDDETQAQLESEAVNYFVMGTENGFMQMVMALKEALLQRNGAIMPDAQERTERTTHRKRNVEPEALGELVNDPNIVFYDYNQGTKELEYTREVSTIEFVMRSIAMDNFLYFSEWNSPTVDGIPVCAVRNVDTRAELKKLGMDPDIVDDLPKHVHDLRSEQKARDPKKHRGNVHTSIDESQDLVEWFDMFVREESDGYDEIHRIAFCYQSGTIIKDEKVPFMNLATGCVIVNPHRFTGMSIYDKLKQIQDERTQLKRARNDNVNATTKNRVAGLEGVVNEDDHANGSVNNMVRVRNTVSDVRQAIMALVVPDTSANIQANLESLARERSEMAGAALDLQSAQAQIGGDRMGSQGLDRAYSVAEQLSAAMMKTIAMTLIRSTYLVAHQVLREYFDEPLTIRRDGKWQQVTPSEWKPRHSVTVKPGLSPGERTAKVNALTDVVNSHLMLDERNMDGVLVDIQGFNKALLDRARAQGLPHPEQYYVDPDSPQAQAELQGKQQQAKQDQMQKAALMQTSLGLEQLRTAFEKYRHDTQLQFDYWNAVLDAEVEEAKIVGDATTKLVTQKREGDSKANGSRPAAGADSSEGAAEQPDT